MVFEKVCLQCGKSFVSEKRKALYCSKECFTEYSKKQIVSTCKHCGKEFKVRSSIYNNGKRLFCNKICFYEHQKTNKYIQCKDYIKIIIISPKYGEIETFIDSEDIDICKKYNWNVSYNKCIKNFYVISSKIQIHRLITKCPKDMVVDHINHNPLDNRKQNLRICTSMTNQQNMKWNSKNTSGAIGVNWCKQKNKWRSRITVNKKELHLGFFEDLNDAIISRRNAELKYFGR